MVLTGMQQPIITSLLDTDAYKLNMQQAIFHHYPDVQVAAEFHCRSNESLAELTSQVEAEIHALAGLSFHTNELDYLASLGLYQQDYLDYLRTFSLQASDVRLSIEQNQLCIHIEGSWLNVILWEVPLLAIICELRSRHLYATLGIKEAEQRLLTKLDKIKDSDKNFNFVDFGTRRRFSKAVHHRIVDTLVQQSPHFVGTSNLYLAMQHNIPVVGTQAHEWFQAHQQLSGELASSQQLALHRWLQEYPDKLGIALTDCINMDAFLHDFNHYLSEQFSGLRHDSGDPILWGEKAIAHYQQLGIDPMSKTLVFSDSLTLEKALGIHQHFSGRIKTSFGIGTQLTCDLPTVTTLNVVIKLVSCNGKPVAKISDEPNKSICRDTKYLAELRRAFNL